MVSTDDGVRYSPLTGKETVSGIGVGDGEGDGDGDGVGVAVMPDVVDVCCGSEAVLSYPFFEHHAVSIGLKN